MYKNFLPFILAIIISYIMTPIVRKLAFKIGAIDIPKDSRRIHKEPMPLLGGLAIYISIVICSLVFIPLEREFMAVLIGGTIILISGIIDDKGDLSPRAKMLFQIIAAIILVMGGVRIEFISNPFSTGTALIYLKLLSIPATIFWVVGITNTVNLIDGLDGLAAGVAGISSLVLMVVAASFGYIHIVILAMIMAGACFGFLPYNFNPAKIFMGDTGALFLGFMLAVVTIEGVMKSVATIAIIVPIIILGVPIFDTAFAILRRLRKGSSITAGDRGHLHHKLLDKGFSQKKTVLILYAISAGFGAFAVLISMLNTRQSVYLSIIPIGIAFIYGFKVGMFGRKHNEEEEE